MGRVKMAAQSTTVGRSACTATPVASSAFVCPPTVALGATHSALRHLPAFFAVATATAVRGIWGPARAFAFLDTKVRAVIAQTMAASLLEATTLRATL